MSCSNSFKSTTIFVGSLSHKTTESKLYQLFGTVGDITSLRLSNAGIRSYAYINYSNINSAEKAIKTMNFRFINGKQCRVMWYQKNHYNIKKCDKTNIFVKNLDPRVDDKILYDTFNVFGEILSCKVQINKFTNKSLGYGYIHFTNTQSAQNAIKGVNGIKILNKPIYAQTFIPKHQRIKTQHFTNVYVKHIPQSFDQQKLKTLFEKTTNGTITHSSFWRKPYGISACLNFSDPNHAKLAIEKLNKYNIDGYQLYVARAQKKSQRQEFLKRKHQYKIPQKYNKYKQIYNAQNIQSVQNMNTFNQPQAINPTQYQSIGNNNFSMATTAACAYPMQLPMQYIQPSVPMQQYIQPQIIQNGNNNNLKQHSVPMVVNTQPQIIYVTPNYSMPNVSQPNICQPQMISAPMMSAPMREKEQLKEDDINKMDKVTGKRIIGERLFSQIQSIEPRLAGKITGMLLELDNKELLMLLDNQKQLCNRINEALDVLKEYQKQKSISNISSNNGSTPNQHEKS